MKKAVIFFATLLVAAGVFAQSPEKMSYQAVIRNASGNIVTTQVGMKLSLLKGSDAATATEVYSETLTPTPNSNGLVSIEFGGQAGWDALDWSSGKFFISSETDPTGGTDYTITGVSQLLSVPYALHATSAETVTGTITENQISDLGTYIETESDPEYNASVASGISQADTAKWNAASVGEFTESDPFFTASQAANITATDITNLSNLSGINTGDQDVSSLATKTALGDSTAQVRNEIPDVSGFITSETDPVYTSSEAANITATDMTNLGNLSGTNTGDQDISGIESNTKAIQDTAAQIRADIPDVSGFIVTETDPRVPTGTQTGQIQYWDGSAWVTISPGYDGATLTLVGGVPNWRISNVTNPTTGEIWMDRNLGALQVATSSTDVDAYGDLYQWGRASDGHQIRTSGITFTKATSDTPGHGNFIIPPSSPNDWRNPQNDNLWQGVSGTNNPCPGGYRLPTEAEWEAERQSWSSNNAAGAFASSLKLPLPGYRTSGRATLESIGSFSYYWSSTVDGTNSRRLQFYSNNALMGSAGRAYGFSVRCIKD